MDVQIGKGAYKMINVKKLFHFAEKVLFCIVDGNLKKKRAENSI